MDPQKTKQIFSLTKPLSSKYADSVLQQIENAKKAHHDQPQEPPIPILGHVIHENQLHDNAKLYVGDTCTFEGPVCQHHIFHGPVHNVYHGSERYDHQFDLVHAALAEQKAMLESVVKAVTGTVAQPGFQSEEENLDAIRLPIRAIKLHLSKIYSTVCREQKMKLSAAELEWLDGDLRALVDMSNRIKGAFGIVAHEVDRTGDQQYHNAVCSADCRNQDEAGGEFSVSS